MIYIYKQQMCIYIYISNVSRPEHLAMSGAPELRAPPPPLPSPGALHALPGAPPALAPKLRGLIYFSVLQKVLEAFAEVEH